MATASKQTPEERAAEKAERTRVARINMVHEVIAKAHNKGERVSTAKISATTGLSESLVGSTIRLVNRTVAGDEGKVLYDFAPKSHALKVGGWTISKRWGDRARWHLTLHKHLTTRAESLLAEAQVAEALFPGDAPAGLSVYYGVVLDTLDKATAVLAPWAGAKGKAPTPKPKQKVKLVS